MLVTSDQYFPRYNNNHVEKHLHFETMQTLGLASKLADNFLDNFRQFAEKEATTLKKKKH